jgi:hypothetical protein
MIRVQGQQTHLEVTSETSGELGDDERQFLTRGDVRLSEFEEYLALVDQIGDFCPVHLPRYQHEVLLENGLLTLKKDSFSNSPGP